MILLRNKLITALSIVTLGTPIFPAFGQSTEANPPSVVKYLPPSLSTDRRTYETQVIRAALEASSKNFGSFEFSAWEGEDINILRGVRELARGERINVGTNPLSKALIHDDIAVIPIPLMKGLLGYRAMIVRRDDAERLSTIKDLATFRKLTLGQLGHWTDIAIYEANKFEVITGASMDVLFTMLTRERFDYIPLGAGEVEKIFASQESQHPELTILPSSYLYYHFPVYTYVCRCEPTLIKRLEKGLEEISKNGVLESLFNKQFAGALKKVNARSTRIFHIENASIPKNLMPKNTVTHSLTPSTDTKK